MIIKKDPSLSFRRRIRKFHGSIQRNTRNRLLALGLFLSFLVGLYLGGYSVLPMAINNGLKKISRFNINYFKNIATGKLSNPRKLFIDISYKNFQHLEFKRSQAFQRGKLIAEDDSYVPATVTADGKTFKVRIRLKGGATDHLEGNKWSLRIKIRNNETIWGMRRFSIQNPKRSGWGHEWVMYEWLKKEGLIALRYDFVDVTINGKNLGIYTLEESFAKELLENNERRDGPILKWDESLFVDQRKTNFGDKVTETDLFYAADVISFTTTKMFSSDELKDGFFNGKKLLMGLRNGTFRFSEVFDVEKAAKSVAILEMINAMHGIRWKNCRFYYNPIVGKLELIVYNAYGPHPIIPISEENRLFYTANRLGYLRLGVPEWRNLFFSDPLFVHHYFAALDRFTSPGYLEAFLGHISSDLKEKSSIIFKDDPDQPIGIPVYYHNRDMLRSFLYPQLALKVCLQSRDSHRMTVSMANATFLPVAVDGIVHSASGQLLKMPIAVSISGKHISEPLEYTSATIADTETAIPKIAVIQKGDRLILQDYKIRYRTPGLKRFRLTDIDATPCTSAQMPPPSAFGTMSLNDMVQRGILSVDRKTQKINIHPGQLKLETDLYIPKGFAVRVSPGTRFILNNSAAMVFYSPVDMSGSEQQPIIVESEDGTGQGLALLSAEGTSTMKHVVFNNISAINKDGWKLTGAVTIYESNTNITHVLFKDSRSEDSLNIVRSRFSISNTRFIGSHRDSLDVDFSSGSLQNSDFEQCGNDCIDFSGSRVEIQGVSIAGAQDKGISVGEKSVIGVKDTNIKNCVIALSSKDMSTTVSNHVRIADVEIGLAAYQKKPEFGGGRIESTKTFMENVGIPFAGDNQSTILHDGTAVQLMPLPVAAEQPL